jgi:CBS domain containing-hemolysin-like protein
VDPLPNPNLQLILASLGLLLSGTLVGLKTIIGFLQKQDPDLLIPGQSGRFKVAVLKAMELWRRPGFFETIAIGRYAGDGMTLYFGTRSLIRILDWPMGWAFSVVLIGAFLIAHWLMPLLAQGLAPRLGTAAIKIYHGYSLFFMGALGAWIFRINEKFLRRMGYDERLSFLGESSLTRLEPNNPEDENLDRSGLKEDEKAMIRSIFEMRETQAREVMTPRVDIVAVDIKSSYRDIMKRIQEEKFSRIPVFEENLDQIRGVLHLMDLVGLGESEISEFSLEVYLKPATFIPRTKKIGELMREFRQKQVHMALVVDEYGGTAGLISLEDILEEIVGEIHDEDEVDTVRVRKIDDSVYVVDPVISLSDLKDETGIELEPEDTDIKVDSLGGFVLYVNGKVPQKGDVVRFNDYSFEILEIDGNKLEKIRLEIPSPVNS